MPLGNTLTEVTTFNPRFQPAGISVGSLLTLGLVYGTGTNGTIGDNGNLQSQTIAVPTLTNTQSYAYDGVNRLSTFTEAATVLQGYSYDSAGIGYGNRWISSGTFIPYSTQTPQSNNFTNNRWASSTNGYDTAGNQTSVFLGSGGTRSFTYDAENRQIAASIPGMSAISYVYDGEGRRVQKTVGSTVTTFVYDAAGNLTAEYGPPSSVAGTTYLTADHLGSTRLVTNSSGAAIARYDYAPFGEELTAGIDGRTTALLFSTNQYPTVTPDGTEQKFTGKERDAESGLDNFLKRYFASTQGRFTSPDPILMSKQKLIDPQQWNLYVYARNNPLRFKDATGMYVCAGTDKQCDAFEKARQSLLSDKNASKSQLRAANAYGDAGKDNGVHVGFADSMKSDRGGTAKTRDGGIEAAPTSEHANGVRAAVDVTILGSRAGSTETIAHEGSHVADYQDVVNSITPTGYDRSLNITGRQSEIRAYQLSIGIANRGNETLNYGSCGLMGECRFPPGMLPSGRDSRINDLLDKNYDIKDLESVRYPQLQ